MAQATYTVGQVVGIFRTGSWSTITEGKYTVAQVNKMKVALRNESGHIREFSAKTGCELGEFASKNTYIVSEERYDTQIAQKQAEQAREKSVADIKNFAAKLGRSYVSKDELTILRALLDEAEKFAIIA